MSKARSPVESCWTDNSEPELATMLDDAPLKAVMTRDGVTRQVVEGLAAGFRRAQLARHADGRVIDPATAICYNLLPPPSERPLPVGETRSPSEGSSAQQQPSTAA